MHKILVTGCAGFIGSSLCESLISRGFNVIGIDNFNDYYNPNFKEENIRALSKNSRFRLYRADIRESSELDDIFSKEKPDATIHLAARAGVRASFENPSLYRQTNVKGTENMLKLAVKYRLKKFVFGSSSSVYGTTRKIPFNEDDLCKNQISPYGETKKEAETLCRNFSSKYKLPVTVLRFFTVYGPRGRPDMAVYKFTDSIAKGIPIKTFGSLDSKRDYTYVSDIVKGIVASLQLKSNFEIINLGDSRPIELKYLISLIEKSLGKKAKVQNMPGQKGDLAMTYADITKAGNLLGYKPEVKIEHGIMLFADWYKKTRLK